MLETPHVLAGAVIASKIGNPWLSLPLSLASHFLLEKVPHWNPHLNTEKNTYGKITPKSTLIVIIDATLALSAGTFIAAQSLPDLNRFIVIMAACFLSVLPDVVEAPYFFLNLKYPFIDRWIKFQKSLQADAQPFFGLATQAVTVAVCLWWLIG